MTTAGQIVAKALQYVGTTEHPPGSNYQIFGQMYGMDGVPWCDEFVSEIGRLTTGNYNFLGKFAYTVSHASWWAAQGRFGYTPSVGALVFYDWNGGKYISGIEHVEIVIKDLGGGWIQTVGGNTGTPEGVHVQTRSSAYVVGYGYPRYSNIPNPIPPVNPGNTAWVKRIQGIVGATVDGVMGPNTIAKIVVWQKAHGCTPDGVWGPATEAAYLKSLNLPRQPHDDALVKRVQNAVRVRATGFWGTDTSNAGTYIILDMHRSQTEAKYTQWHCGLNGSAVDGIWGSGSESARTGAIKRIQAAMGISADGVWGPTSQARWNQVYNSNYGK